MISCEQYISDLDIKNNKFDIKGIKENPDIVDRYIRRNQKGRVNDRYFIIATGIYHVFDSKEEWKNNLEYINDVLVAFGYHKVYPRKPRDVVYFYCLLNNLTYKDYQSIISTEMYSRILKESTIMDKREILNPNEYRKRYKEKKEEREIDEYIELKKRNYNLNDFNKKRFEELNKRYCNMLNNENKYKNKSKHITVGWMNRQILKEQENEKYTRQFTMIITNHIKELSHLDKKSNYNDFLKYLDNDYKMLYTLNYATTTYYLRKNLYEYIIELIHKVVVAQEKSRKIEYCNTMDDYYSEIVDGISNEIYEALCKVPIQGEIELLKNNTGSEKKFERIEIRDVRAKIWFDDYGGNELDRKSRKMFQDRVMKFDIAKINIKELTNQLIGRIGLYRGIKNGHDKDAVSAFIYREMLEIISGRLDVERSFMFFVMASIGKKIDEINSILAKCGFYIIQDTAEDRILMDILIGEPVTCSQLCSVGLAPRIYRNSK